MDEHMKGLVAMGASAAVNCHPCMEHWLAECDRLGISREDVKTAIKVGLMANQGAAAKTGDKADALLGTASDGMGGQRGCGCRP
jgi:alkylhydroperoxidase/carboxymuconolactone decarboxylase family protein YurZ